MNSLHIIPLLFLSVASIAQPNIGLQFTTKGVGFNAGWLFKNVVVTAAYKTPLMSREVPKVASLSIGHQLYLTNNDENNVTLTPSIGIGYTSAEDFTQYNADTRGIAPIIKVKGVKPMYTLELAKDAHLGRVFLQANYCGHAYYGIGIKCFLYR